MVFGVTGNMTRSNEGSDALALGESAAKTGP
jgi:hypothetical protein